MANTKISALTSATTPLAGTEVLPIVQSSTTVKVATNDLTVRNIRANATTGILQVTGPTAASTRVVTVPDANFTAARTDAAQSFTGDQTLSTGNLVIGTSGKGIDFSATAGTGTSELLADYEEGTFTPSYTGSGGNPTVTYSTQSGVYTKVGRLVTFRISLSTTSSSGGSGNLGVNGLPFAASSGQGCSLQFSLGFASNVLQPTPQTSNVLLYDTYAGTSNNQAPTSALTSAGGSTFLFFVGQYFV
jgi:hypothetical protein